MSSSEEMRKKADEFRKIYEEARARQVLYELHPDWYKDTKLPIPGEVLESTLEPNPNGYNTAEIVAIRMGNAHMISKGKK